MALAVINNLPVREDFRESWLAGQLSGHTARAYEGDIRQFLEFIGGDNISAVRRQDLFRFRAWLMESLPQGDGTFKPRFKPATINRKLSAVRQLFAEAVRHGIIDRSPAEGMKGYKTAGISSSTRAPSEEQVTALLESMGGDSLPDMRDYAMIYVMAGMGLRRSEVSQIRTGDFGEDQGIPVLTVHGKGNKERRLRVPETVLGAVRRWTDAVFEGLEDVPVFQELIRNGGYHLSGKALTPNGIYHVTRRRLASQGIENLSCHSFRHFCLTYLFRAGCDLYKAQTYAGHSDPRTTQRYDHSREDLDSSAANYINF